MSHPKVQRPGYGNGEVDDGRKREKEDFARLADADACIYPDGQREQRQRAYGPLQREQGWKLVPDTVLMNLAEDIAGSEDAHILHVRQPEDVALRQ